MPTAGKNRDTGYNLWLVGSLFSPIGETVRLPGKGPTKKEISTEGEWGDVDSATGDGRAAEGDGERKRKRWTTPRNERWVSTRDARTTPGVEWTKTTARLEQRRRTANGYEWPTSRDGRSSSGDDGRATSETHWTAAALPICITSARVP